MKVLARVDAVERMWAVVLEWRSEPDKEGNVVQFAFASRARFYDRRDAVKEYEAVVASLGLERNFDPNAPF